MDMPGLPSAGKPQAQGMPQGFGLDCVPEVRKVPEKKSFAGFEAEGFEIACPGEPQTMTLWMASGGALAQAEKETAAFFKSMAEKQYANYPEAERQEILKNIEKLGAAYSMMRLPDMKDLPENGMLVAMEAGGLGQASSPNGSMLIYEIAEVDTRKADPSLFEIPEGYTRVGSIEQEMTQQIMGGSGLGAFAQMFQDAASQGGSADPSYPGAQADLPPPGMVRRPGPNGWEYVPAGETEQVRPAGVPAAPVSGTAGASGRSEGEEEAPPGMIRKPGPNGWVYVPASEA